MMNKLIISLPRLIFIVALLLALCACGVRFTYNQLDTIIPWYLDDYMEFSGEQQDLLESRLAQQLQWHRSTQLPTYAKSLRRIEHDLANSFNRRHLYQHRDQIKQYWQTLTRRITPDLVVILNSASDQQIEELFANLEEKNQEFQEEYVDLSERDWREKRVEQMRKHLKRWLGEVSTPQKRLIRDWSERLKWTSATTLEYRRQWQQRLRQALKHRHEDEKLTQALQTLLIDPEQIQPTALREMREYNTEIFFDLVLQLHEQLSSSQQVFLSNRIMSLADDFETLASTD